MRLRSPSVRVPLALAVLILLAAGLPGASTASPSPGRLYLTGTVLAAPTGHGGTGGKAFALLDAAPGAGAPAKAYLGTSADAVTWTNAFNYTAASAFAMSGTVTARILVSCDKAAVYRPVVPGYVGNSGVILLLDGHTVGSVGREDQGAVCKGPDDVRSMNYSFEVPRTAVAPGQVLSLQFDIYWSNTDDSVQPNGYVVTGPSPLASFIEAAGLPLSASVATAQTTGPVVQSGWVNTTTAPGVPASPGPAGSLSGGAKGAPGFDVGLAASGLAGVAVLALRKRL